MATVLKPYRLANPLGRSKRKNVSRRRKNSRKMSPLQKLYFGSKRVRAAISKKLKGKRRSNPKYKLKGIRRKRKAYKYVKPYSFRTVAKNRGRRRRRNVGKIIVHRLGNSGRRKKNIAAGFYDEDGIFHPIRSSYDYSPGRVGEKRKKSKSKSKKGRKVSKRRKNSGMARRRRRVARRHHRRSNRGRMYNRRRRVHGRKNPTVVYRYKRHHRRRNRGRRRNPGFFSGRIGQIGGVILGATTTKLISDRLPMGFNTGWLGIFSTVAVAFLQGKLVGRFAGASLGNDMVLGGYTYAALRVVQTLFPSIYTSLGLQGLGMIGGNNFFVPQVNKMGSMGSFVRPPGVPAPVVSKGGLGGIQRNAVGGGRMGMRRMGRLA